MSRKDFSFALEDDLFAEYLKLTNPDAMGNAPYDKDTIKKLLPYHLGEFIYNTAQLERIHANYDETSKSRLKRAGLSNQTIEELAQKTFFRGVLSSTKTTYPYIKIGGDDEIVPSMGGSFHDTRDKAIKHLKALCSDAKTIVIWDQYLHNDESINGLKQILPRVNGIKIIIHDQDCRAYQYADALSKVRRIHDGWQVVTRNLNAGDHHDRYIILDDDQEIIITSGLDHLAINNKEITYIVKPYANDHLGLSVI